MKVLVTGANGFLGSWLVRELIQQGSDVRILARAQSDMRELEGLVFEKSIGDVTDQASVANACLGVDTVFHLAGLVAYNRNQRTAMEKVNVGGTQNVISAVKKKSVRRLVHLSSVTAIGASFDRTPLSEESSYNIHHLDLGYFETKKISEDLVKAAVHRREIDAVILNPATIYGPGDAKKGSRKTQIKVAQGKLPFYTSGGVNVVAVEDVVDGIISAWHRGRSGERYILSGENILIKDLFHLIAKEAKVNPPRIGLPRFAVHTLGWVGDNLERIGLRGPISSENAWTAVLYHWFDCKKAMQELAFNPRPAAHAISRSVQWMKEKNYI